MVDIRYPKYLLIDQYTFNECWVSNDTSVANFSHCFRNLLFLAHYMSTNEINRLVIYIGHVYTLVTMQWEFTFNINSCKSILNFHKIVSSQFLMSLTLVGNIDNNTFLRIVQD